MTITIKFIHDSNNGFTKIYRNLSNMKLNELNQNYVYKIFWIKLSDVQNFAFMRSRIIIFENIDYSQHLTVIIKKIKHLSPLANFIFISKKINQRQKIKLLNIGIDYFIESNMYCVSLLKVIIKNILDKLFYIDTYNSIFLYANDYCLDTVDKKIWKDENQISITRKEFDLFKYFVMNKNKIIDKEEILEKVWGYVGIFDSTNIVSQHIFRIRKKLKLHNLINLKREGYVYKEHLKDGT
ncbi:MAG: winged helix-turn-helix domain-containing protein [Malacoplasma sp.]